MMMPPRSAVSIVVPFAGTPSELRDTVGAFASMHLSDQDELLIVDNSAAPVEIDALPPRFRLLRAAREGSSYHARNVGALNAVNDWILFLDADCVPAADLIDRYDVSKWSDAVGGVAGKIDAHTSDTLVGRYASSRGHLDAEAPFEVVEIGWAQTANFLVRKRVWDALGGFCEGIRSGGDVDLSWRLQKAGWQLVPCPAAVVEHRHRETLRGLIKQYRRYGAGQAWLRRRFPGRAFGERLVRQSLKASVGLFTSILRLDFEEAMFAVLDLAALTAVAQGRFEENGPAWTSPVETGGTAYAAWTAPAADGTTASASGRISAVRRADQPRPWLLEHAHVTYWEDISRAEQIASLWRIRSGLRGSVPPHGPAAGLSRLTRRIGFVSLVSRQKAEALTVQDEGLLSLTRD
jgi:GT2 family glycosyltransferase